MIRRSPRLLCFLRPVLLGATLLALPACQQQRLEQLEAAQQEQARELAQLRETLAERDEEVARLETCVDDLEGAVYEDEDDSTAPADEPPVTQL